MLSSLLPAERLYTLSWRNAAPAEVEVEAWWGVEHLSAGFELCIEVLAPDAFIDLKAFMGQPLTLWSTLADGGRAGRSGLVRSALNLGADGGLCRYRLVVVPWSWLLSRGRHNRVFQDKSVVEIVEAVFADYTGHAAWTWSPEVSGFLADTRPRSYCVQYRESDYAFVSRLLAEEGLGWCVEEDDDAPAGHRLRLFADSPSLPEDALSAASPEGIRFHRADSQEAQDAVVALGARRQLDATVTTVLGYDYKAKRAVAASVPTAHRFGGAHAPVLEDYDYAGQYAFADPAAAERAQRLAMEAREARYKGFFGRSSVRSLRPGTVFRLTGSPLDDLPGRDPNAPDPRRFALVSVTHVGINNLSGESIERIAARLAAPLALMDEPPGSATGDPVEPARAPQCLPAEAVQRAARRGYANQFDALRAHIPWRPVLRDDTGQRLNPRPTAPGPMSAIVVGPEGNTRPNGADELWCDALGRIKVRFHWQKAEAPDDRGSCWLRVATRQAGGGMGWQWLPRIGQEVLVAFMDNDIDRPVVLGALYNGQGEGGETPTPGDKAGALSNPESFDAAADHTPAGQGNRVGGNSPAWHGGASTRHGHAAALSGFKTKEFGANGGAAGYNQLVLDDSDDQQRVQLKTTQHASALNLGHLIHQADNYRGSFRGRGAELRTDAWGALRAGQGLVMSTWRADSDAQPAGDLAPGIALLRQAATLGHTLSDAAGTHQSVKLASALGTAGAGQSALDPQAAPLDALAKVVAGMVDPQALDAARQDAADKNTAVAGKVPHLTDPALIQSGRAGIGLVAGQHLQWAHGETITLASGADTDLAIAGRARLHSGQAIGLVAGAIGPGEANTGIDLIAAGGDITLQAQSDEMKFQAKQDVKLVSVGADLDLAAAKKIVLSVAGGASITIDGGITVQCPGTLTVHAGKKSFAGPASMNRGLPAMPRSKFELQGDFPFSA